MGKFFEKTAEVYYDDPGYMEQAVSAPLRGIGKLLMADSDISVRGASKIDSNTRRHIETLQQENPGVEIYVGHSPIGKRLKRVYHNKGVFKNPIAKILFGYPGALSASLAGKIAGGDFYDPISKTINIRSNIPAIVAHEVGHYQDLGTVKHPVLYRTVSNFIPLTDDLLLEYNASSRAGKYLKKHNLDSSILTPAYASHLGKAVPIVGKPMSPLAAIVGGHMVKTKNDWKDMDDGVIAALSKKYRSIFD